MKKIVSQLVAVALFGAVSGAQAAAVYFATPTTQNVTLGNTVSFDVMVDFRDAATVGGLFAVTFDAARLGNGQFAYDAAFAYTFGTTTGTSPTTDLTSIGFDGAFSGNARLGTVSFTAIGAGTAMIGTAAYPDSSYQFLNESGSSLLTVNYDSAATVNISAVPAPAALWLMASGLGALGVGLRRRAV